MNQRDRQYLKEGETLMIDYKQKTAELILEKSPSLAGELSVTDIAQAIEVPSDKKMGDYAFPCFRLAKVLRKAPPLIAQDIAAAKDFVDRMEHKLVMKARFAARQAEKLAALQQKK